MADERCSYCIQELLKVSPGPSEFQTIIERRFVTPSIWVRQTNPQVINRAMISIRMASRRFIWILVRVQYNDLARTICAMEYGFCSRYLNETKMVSESRTLISEMDNPTSSTCWRALAIFWNVQQRNKSVECQPLKSSIVNQRTSSLSLVLPLEFLLMKANTVGWIHSLNVMFSHRPDGRHCRLTNPISMIKERDLHRISNNTGKTNFWHRHFDGVLMRTRCWLDG